MTFDGIVVAGGGATRLGGVDKPALTINGRSMLDIAVGALDGAAHVVTVGTEVTGGPVAAIGAGLTRIEAPEVVVLAADLPFITADAIARLVASRGGAAAAIAVDASGHDQPLIGCYDAAELRAALPIEASGTSMRRVIAALDLAGTVARIDLGGDPPACADCDTPQDLARARESG